MSDEKFKSLEDLPTAGDTFKEILKNPDKGPFAIPANLLNESTGSTRNFLEEEFKKACIIVDAVKYAQQLLESQGTDLFSTMEKAVSDELGNHDREEEG